MLNKTEFHHCSIFIQNQKIWLSTNYQFKVNDKSARKNVKQCSKVNYKYTRTWCLYCEVWTYFTSFSSASIVDFEQVNFFKVWLSYTRNITTQKYLFLTDFLSYAMFLWWNSVKFWDVLRHAQTVVSGFFGSIFLSKFFHFQLATGIPIGQVVC